MSNDSNDPNSPSGEPAPEQPGGTQSPPPSQPSGAPEPPQSPYQQSPPPPPQGGYGQQPPPPPQGGYGQQPPQYGEPAGYPPPPGYGAQQPGYPPAGGYPPGAVMRAPYSIGDAFNYGWKKFRENVGPILILALIAFVIIAIASFISWLVLRSGTTTTETAYGTMTTTSFSFGQSIFSFLISVIGAILALIVSIGIVRAALDVTYGRRVETATVFSVANIGSAAVTYILVGVGTFIGTLLCIVPGIIFAFFAQYSIYFVLDKDLSPVDAIKASFSFVNANLGTLIGFYLCCALALFVGYILCGIGLLVAYPVVIIASAYTYRVLQGEQVAP